MKEEVYREAGRYMQQTGKDQPAVFVYKQIKSEAIAMVRERRGQRDTVIKYLASVTRIQVYVISMGDLALIVRWGRGLE